MRPYWCFVLGLFIGMGLLTGMVATLPPQALKGFSITCESGAYVDAEGVRRIEFTKRTC
jgi:hypothetical protein